jgi:hypothetical protein
MGIRNPRKRKREFIALLSTTGSLIETEKREEKQERYIRNFVKTQDIEIVGVVRRNGLGQADLNRQFEKITQMIRQKRAEGVIVVNMMAISTDIPDAYYKVGKIIDAGGIIMTVDEGNLGMSVKTLRRLKKDEQKLQKEI